MDFKCGSKFSENSGKENFIKSPCGIRDYISLEMSSLIFYTSPSLF
jgi:hypothetical protein